MGACLSKSEIREILNGELTIEAESHILTHLEECSSCQARLWGDAGGSDGIPSLSASETLTYERSNLSKVIQALQQSWRIAKVSNVDKSVSQSDFSGKANLGKLESSEPRISLPSRYRITEPIAAGGFGEVYRAFDELLQRPVAIKAPRSHLSHTSAEDFLAEARVLAQLDHPHIVPIYDFGRSDDGHCYIASKWIDGPDLAQRLSTVRYREKQAVECLERVARGLHHAHERGVIHCDIKPGNILLDEDDTPVLVDFGLAVTREPCDRDQYLAGTPAYMSPEQFRLGRSEIDARSDVWSLGVVLIEMLIGEPPFAGDSLEEIKQKIDTSSPQDVLQSHDVSPQVNEICTRALGRNRVERYQTAADFADDLARLSRQSTTRVSTSRTTNAKFAHLKIPIPSTSFVGRVNELGQLNALLDSKRMVTIVGPGGAGKTRLAIEVASKALKQEGREVCYVALANIEAGGEVAVALAEALRLPPSAKPNLAKQAVEYIADEELLLIFDNCEHVLIQVAEIVKQLLIGCQELKVLATSREHVGVEGEQVFRVRSLDTLTAPPSDEESTFELPEAVQLYTERARLKDPGFCVDASNRFLVSKVCDLVDGMPMAIELAAARTGAIPLDVFVSHLEQQLPEAVDGGVTIAGNSATSLAGSLEWSLDLLGEEERELLAAVSVFRGGWTHSAAHQVCRESDGEFSTLGQLESLVNKSLVDLRLQSRRARYFLVEYVRQTMYDTLQTSQAATLSGKHFDYFRQLAREAEPAFFSEDQAEWYQRLNDEIENFRIAIEWSLRADCDPLACLSFAGDLGYFWYMRGSLSEGLRHLEKALMRDESEEPTVYRIRALTNAGWIAHRLGKLEQAYQLREEGLNSSIEIDYQPGVANGYNTLALNALERGQLDEAKDLHHKSLAIRQQIDHQWGVASSQSNLATIYALEGKQLEAISLLTEAVKILRDLGDKFCVAGNLIDLSWLQLGVNHPDLSIEAVTEAMQIALDNEFREIAVVTIEAAVAIALDRGLVDVAAKGMDTARTHRNELGLRRSMLERERMDVVEEKLERLLPSARQEQPAIAPKPHNLWREMRDLCEAIGAGSS